MAFTNQSKNTGSFSNQSKPVVYGQGDYLLKEDGDALLLENGDKILLETSWSLGQTKHTGSFTNLTKN